MCDGCKSEKRIIFPGIKDDFSRYWIYSY